VEAFAANCAHDFNNLLTGILGNLELMQNRARRNGVTSFDGYLEGARNAAGRAADFSQRLLVFSGRATQEPVPVPVNALARDIIELMREQSRVVVGDLAEGPDLVLCDPAQLELALLELMDNASAATGGQGGVTLRSRFRADEICLAVADTGIGMAPDLCARVTEPFFSTRPSGAGKGLGLAIVERFARDAGGAVTIDSALGQGTTVTLSLPLLEGNR
jgi:signal transduction histidine kinase